MNNNLIKCPYCEEEIDKDSVRCEYCDELIKRDYVIVNNSLINNSYHILGLDTSSSQKQISKRAKDILKYLAIGEVPDFENDLYFTNEYRNEIFVKSAMDSLTNPKDKIINTFFWFDIENDDDKSIFSIYNTKNYNNAIDLFNKSDNKKNLAILYTLLLLDPNISSDYSEYVENSLDLFKEIQDDDKFWRMFEKKYFLFDDISTNKDLISEFRKDLGKHLSNIFYDISAKLGDDTILKKFHKYFKNTKGNKANEQVEKIYLDLGKLSRELEDMNISEDGVFDDDEKVKVKKIHYDITLLLRKLQDLGLYDDSKTLIIRDTVAEAFRTIMLDLNNELNEEDEALKVLNYALDIVGTDGLKHKIKEEYKTITANIKLKPVIQLLDEEDFIGASEQVEKLEKEKLSAEDQRYLKNLKKRAVFGRLGKGFIDGKDLFEKEDYIKARKYFNKVEELAEKNIELFEGINPEGLINIVKQIKEYLAKVEKGKLDFQEVINYIDELRASILEKLPEEDSYFFIFYFDSLTYGYISELNAGNTKSDTCYFCGKEKAMKDKYVPVSMYKITKNFDILIYSNKKFRKTEVQVPICEKCNEVREKNSGGAWKAFFIALIGVIIFAFLGGEEMFFFGAIGGIIAFVVMKKNFKHEDTGRIIDNDPNHYEIIKEMQSEGWKLGDGPQ